MTAKVLPFGAVALCGCSLLFSVSAGEDGERRVDGAVPGPLERRPVANGTSSDCDQSRGNQLCWCTTP